MGVDVVIVNWNGGPELVAAVDSALRFGGRPIVVDNASSRTAARDEVALRPDVTVIRNSTNMGFASGCNTGAAAGSGDVLMLLNPDAEILAGTAADMERAFDDSHAMVVGPLLEGTAGQPLSMVRPLPSGLDLVADLLRMHSLRGRLGRTDPAPQDPRSLMGEASWMVGSALAMRRADWDRLGGLDAGFFLWFEDVDLGARVARVGGSIVLTDKVRVRHQGASTWVRLPRRRRQWLRVRGAWRYARHHLGWISVMSIGAAALPALAIGFTLDLVHWLARRP